MPSIVAVEESADELDDLEFTIPIRLPFILNRPPPELPEFIAAFV